MVNMECMFKTNLGENYTIKGVVISTVWPLITLAIMIGGLFILKKCKKLNTKYTMTDYIILMVVVIFYLWYPTLCDKAKILLICSEIEEGEYWLVDDYQI